MDHLSIEGVRPYDGRYEFDLRGGLFSVREWGWVKRFSGYLPMTLDEGLEGADAELMAVFALIALARSGKIQNDEVPRVWDRFADAPGVVTVRLELEERPEDDADPPPRSSSENGSTSGDGSKTNSERSAPPPAAIGTPASATSAFLPEIP